MRINYDCIRDVLLSLEDMLVLDKNLETNSIAVSELCTELPDYSRQDIAYSLVKLKETDYINARVINADNGILDIIVFSITFEGHKYLDTVRTSAVWEKTKKTFKEKAVEMTIETIMLVAKSIIQSQLIS